MLRLCAILAVVAVGCSQPSKDKKDNGNGTEETSGAATAAGHDAAPAAPGEPDERGSAELVKVPAELAAKVTLKKVLDGFDRPVALEVAPGDESGRLYVVEQGGRIYAVEGDKRHVFLDLRRKVTRAGNEQGLLGLAFHPGFASNRKLYVNYTDNDGATQVVEYRITADRKAVDTSSRRRIFEVRQPFSNHNAGDLEFGPDGKLYVGLGDGGAGGDPIGAGQDDRNVLGKMLRIDVDAPEPTRTIVMKGLRNPWRYHFDPETGDLYIGDVGQNQWEEVHVLAKGEWDGVNLGWNIMEGTHCFKPEQDCPRDGLTMPVVEYSHDEGCSITGGEVYRGKAIAELEGVYFYADYCRPFIIRSFRWSKAKGVREHWDWTKAFPRIEEIASFGHDAAGELYVVSLQGPIYKLDRK